MNELNPGDFTRGFRGTFDRIDKLISYYRLAKGAPPLAGAFVEQGLAEAAGRTGAGREAHRGADVSRRAAGAAQGLSAALAA